MNAPETWAEVAPGVFRGRIGAADVTLTDTGAGQWLWRVAAAGRTERGRSRSRSMAEEAARRFASAIEPPAEPVRAWRATLPARRAAGFTLLELAAVVSLLTILSAIAVPTYSAQRRQAKDGACRIALTSIELGVETYARDHDGTYPEEATRESLAGCLDRWPANPFTGRPMTPGEDVGDYVYTVSDDLWSFALTVHLSNGGSFALPSGFPMPTPAASP